MSELGVYIRKIIDMFHLKSQIERISCYNTVKKNEDVKITLSRKTSSVALTITQRTADCARTKTFIILKIENIGCVHKIALFRD